MTRIYKQIDMLTPFLLFYLLETRLFR